MNTLAVALLGIVLSVAAQFALKWGMASEAARAALAEPLRLGTGLRLLTLPGILGGFLLYGLGAVVWLGVLARWEVSKAYPLVGLGFVLTASIGWAFGEQVGWTRALGVALICLGVVIVGRS